MQCQHTHVRSSVLLPLLSDLGIIRGVPRGFASVLAVSSGHVTSVFLSVSDSAPTLLTAIVGGVPGGTGSVRSHVFHPSLPHRMRHECPPAAKALSGLHTAALKPKTGLLNSAATTVPKTTCEEACSVATKTVRATTQDS